MEGDVVSLVCEVRPKLDTISFQTLTFEPNTTGCVPSFLTSSVKIQQKEIFLILPVAILWPCRGPGGDPVPQLENHYREPCKLPF